MDWIQVLTIIGVNLGIFMWLRTEGNADRRHLQTELAADRREMLQIIRNIQDEMKDFHTKMCIFNEKLGK